MTLRDLRFCSLYPISIITGKYCIDFHYWDQIVSLLFDCPFYPLLHPLSLKTEEIDFHYLDQEKCPSYQITLISVYYNVI